MSYFSATYNHEFTDGYWCEADKPTPGADGNAPQCAAPGHAGPCDEYWNCLDVTEHDDTEPTDSPVHCQVCEELLSTELTSAGEEYVREQVAPTYSPDVQDVWAETWPHLTVPATPAIPDNAASEEAGELELFVIFKGRTGEGRLEYRWWVKADDGRVWSARDLCSGVGSISPDAEAMLPVLAGFLSADAETYGSHMGVSQPEDGYMFGEALAALAYGNSDELGMLSARDELDSDNES